VRLVGVRHHDPHIGGTVAARASHRRVVKVDTGSRQRGVGHLRPSRDLANVGTEPEHRQAALQAAQLVDHSRPSKMSPMYFTRFGASFSRRYSGSRTVPPPPLAPPK